MKKILPLLSTMAGEAYQPARIYYQVGKKNVVLEKLKRLRCIDYDSAQNRWVWLHTEEARNILNLRVDFFYGYLLLTQNI